MNRNRWALIATVAAVAAVAAAVLAATIGVSRLSNDGRAGEPQVPPLREAFGFDAAYADPDPMVLVVRYGDSSSCPSLAVRHDVVQVPDRVVVTLTRTPMSIDQACTSDYGAKLIRISLIAPLGSRAVIDGSRTKTVPISTGTPPFG